MSSWYQDVCALLVPSCWNKTCRNKYLLSCSFGARLMTATDGNDLVVLTCMVTTCYQACPQLAASHANTFCWQALRFLRMYLSLRVYACLTYCRSILSWFYPVDQCNPFLLTMNQTKKLAENIYTAIVMDKGISLIRIIGGGGRGVLPSG